MRKIQKMQAIADLREGKTVRIKGKGNSMTPRIKSGAFLTIEPVKLADVQVGDAVMCKVRGNIYDAHLVTALKGGPDNRQVQISNNHGRVNGWTTAVYGRVIEVENP
jgi:phage repressor protein C with HTH and peptisase S24 domain